MLDGIMALWFVLTAFSVLYVALDIRRTPESGILKWGFVLVTLYTGPVGAFLYVLGCREPLPGLHERYVAARWRQVLGSTMHCVAGDGVGILAGAVIGSLVALSAPAELVLEYVLGFGFGWAIFQALFMRGELGDSYPLALRKTFIPELLSMNMLMAGMVPVMRWAKSAAGGVVEPTEPLFWFIMSMALLVGFVVAYPINWWLVSNHLKHGMMTVRPAGDEAAHSGGAPPEAATRGGIHGGGHGSKKDGNKNDRMPSHGSSNVIPTVTTFAVTGMSAMTFAIFATALIISL